MNMEYKSLNFDVKAVTQEVESGDWIIEGYASTYTLDNGGDRIRKGAFTETIAERFTNQKALNGKSKIKILWQHKTDAIIGSLLEIREDDTGLYVSLKLINDPDFKKAAIAYKLAKMGEIDSFSIGYKTAPCDCVMVDEGDMEIREIIRLKLYEISIVTFPMNEQAEFTNVKNDEELTKVDEQVIELLKEIKMLLEPKDLCITITEVEDESEGETPEMESDSTCCGECGNLLQKDCKACGKLLQKMCPSCNAPKEEVVEEAKEEVEVVVEEVKDEKLSLKEELLVELKQYIDSLFASKQEEKELVVEEVITVETEVKATELSLEDLISNMLTKEITL